MCSIHTRISGVRSWNESKETKIEKPIKLSIAWGSKTVVFLLQDAACLLVRTYKYSVPFSIFCSGVGAAIHLKYFYFVLQVRCYCLMILSSMAVWPYCAVWLLPLMSRRKMSPSFISRRRKGHPVYLSRDGTQESERQLASYSCWLHVYHCVFSVSLVLVGMKNVSSSLQWPFRAQVLFYMLKVKKDQRVGLDGEVHQIRA